MLRRCRDLGTEPTHPHICLGDVINRNKMKMAPTKEQPNTHVLLSSRWVTASPMAPLSHSLIVIAVCYQRWKARGVGERMEGEHRALIGGADSGATLMEGETGVVARKERRFRCGTRGWFRLMNCRRNQP
jgi:hypothetical protein